MAVPLRSCGRKLWHYLFSVVGKHVTASRVVTSGVTKKAMARYCAPKRLIRDSAADSERS